MKATHADRGSNPGRSRNSNSRQFRPGFLPGMAVLIGLVVLPSALATEKGSASSMTVLVFNFRQVAHEVLANAENEAGSIFERSGVHVTWRDCPTGSDPCRKGSGCVLFLAIVAGPVQNTKLDTISGTADPSVHLASVHYDYLPHQPGGHQNSSDMATVLGGVIAHELGHLLLGAHGHSVTGIMRGTWDFEQTQRALMSQLSFLPEETEILQSVLREGTQPLSGAASGLVSKR